MELNLHNKRPILFTLADLVVLEQEHCGLLKLIHDGENAKHQLAQLLGQNTSIDLDDTQRRLEMEVKEQNQEETKAQGSVYEQPDSSSLATSDVASMLQSPVN